MDTRINEAFYDLDDDLRTRRTFRFLLMVQLQDLVCANAPSSMYVRRRRRNTFATPDAISGLRVSEASLSVANALLEIAEEVGAIRREGKGRWRVLYGEKLYGGEFESLVRRYDIDAETFAAIGRAAA